MKEKKKCLDMGCGPEFMQYQDDDYEITYLDYMPRNVKPFIQHNLNKYPYPFKDNSFDVIICYDVLEHLHLYDNQNEYWINLFNEIYRILKPNGVIKIRTPHYASNSHLMEHHNLFSIGDFTMKFDGKAKSWYDSLLKDIEFRIDEIKIIFPRLNKPFGWLINHNKKTLEIYERYLSGIIRSQDIYIVLRAIKN